MNRIEKLKNKVDELYERKQTGRADWADYLYQKHIFIVAENAKLLAKRFGANMDIVIAASMLHDIADAIMARENPEHEERGNLIARDYLKECDFGADEIKIIVDDAIKFHGCKNSEIPKTLEGKVMATADATAHLKSDFYDYALIFLKKTDSMEEIKNWALPKIERDYWSKIFFDEIRTEAKVDYERVKALFKG